MRRKQRVYDVKQHKKQKRAGYMPPHGGKKCKKILTIIGFNVIIEVIEWRIL
jgi:hypothetical protein